jgi:ribonuclease HII
MARGLIAFDKRALGGAESLVGIDEAGRGCLAGPVVAVALRCSREFYTASWCRYHVRKVDDSKRLSAGQRAAVVACFRHACRENWIQIGIGSASVEEIERHNIYQANALAMRRACEQVYPFKQAESLWEPVQADVPGALPVLIDGRPIRTFPVPHTGVVKGDQRSLAIALAGIHAKEWRDARMRELDAAYPGYGFAEHKGYGTPAHLAALRTHGPTPHHRSLFLRKFHAANGSAGAEIQDSLFNG